METKFKMYIFEFGFNVAEKLREKNANLDVKKGEILLKKFSDGEFYARVIGKYLFSWEDIPENDSERLLKLLKDDLKIEWVENAKIEKSNDGKVITIKKENNSLVFKLNPEKSEVILEITGGYNIMNTVYLEKENDKINIYYNEVENKDCVVVKSVYNNDEFVRTILILDAIKRSNPKSITFVAPYLTYMRQDKIFIGGEALSAEVILKILNIYANKIFLINSHLFRESGERTCFGIKIYNMDAFAEIGKYFTKLKNPKVISPDKGAMDLAEKCGKILNCESNCLEKTRYPTGVSIKDKDLKIEGKDVLITDDIIASGGTMIEALKIIKKQNPASINLACVHGVFCDAENFLTLRILADELASTNSIPNKVAKIDLSDLIAEELVKNGLYV